MLGDCCRRERELSVQFIGVRMLFCCASGVAFDAIAYAAISSGYLQERELRLRFEGEVHMLCLFPCRTCCKVDPPGKHGEDWKCLMTNSLLKALILGLPDNEDK